MALSTNDQVTVDSFFAAVAPVVAAYRHSTFGFVAVHHNGEFVLVRARLHLSVVAPKATSKSFSSKIARAGNHSIDEYGGDAADIARRLVSGSFDTPVGPIVFRPTLEGFSCQFTPFHEEGMRIQTRMNLLTIRGEEPQKFITQPTLDWELRAGAIPYESIGDVMADFSVGLYQVDATIFEILTEPVAMIDVNSSLTGAKSMVTINVAESLDTGDVGLGYHRVNQNRPVERSFISGRDIKWQAVEGIQKGTAEIEVQPGDVLHCFLSYAGMSQHHYWLVNIGSLPNPFRTVYEAFDDKLVVLSQVLANAEGRGRQARDFEAAVAWLLWIHGYYVLHIGGTQGSQVQGPDIIVMTPSGHFGVVECTTKHLGSDKKLPDLIANSEKLRRKLDAAGLQNRMILRVLATSLRSTDVAAEREEAEHLGVLVVTREDLERWAAESIPVPNPNLDYERGIQRVVSTMARYVDVPSEQ